MALYNRTEEHVNRTLFPTAGIDAHKQNQTENEIVINNLPALEAQQGSNEEESEELPNPMPLSSNRQPLITNSYPATTTDKYDRWRAEAVEKHNNTHTHIAHIRSKIEVCVSNVAERDAQIKDLREGIAILEKEKEGNEQEIQEARETIEICSNRIAQINMQLDNEETNTTTVSTLERPVRDLQKQEKEAECKTAEVTHLKSERIRLRIEKKKAQALVRRKREEVTEYKEKIKQWREKHRKAVGKRKKADTLLRELADMTVKTHDTAADAAAHANATISTNKHTRRSVAHTSLNDKNEGGNMGTMNYTEARNQIEKAYSTIVKKLSFNKASKTPCSNGNDKDELAAVLDLMRKSNLSHSITSNESSTSYPIPSGLDHPITMQTLSAICSGVIGIATATDTDNSTESNNKENTNWYYVMVAAAAGMVMGVLIQPVVAYVQNKLKKNVARMDITDNQESICFMDMNSQLVQDLGSFGGFGDTRDGSQSDSNQTRSFSNVFVNPSS